MKKKISIALALVLLMGTNTSVFATTPKNVSTANQQINSKSKILLKNSNIAESDITTVNMQDVLSSKQLNKAAMEDAQLKSKGYSKGTTLYYITKNTNESTSKLITNSTSLAPNYTIVDVIRQYNGSTTTRKNSKYGMSYWVDVAFNMVIGSYTKYVWKAATILGVNPSNFYSTAKPGDMLNNHVQLIYHDRYYRQYNSRTKETYSLLRTSKLVLTNYVDLYTVDKNDNAIRESSSESKNYYSHNYSNSVWINTEISTNALLNGMTITYDTF